MISVRIDNSDVVRQLSRFHARLMVNVTNVAPIAAEVIAASVRNDLRQKILRPRESTSLLESEIDGVAIWRGGDMILGIGDIARLNSRVPYWALQNDGGPIASDVVPGFFVDQSGARVRFDPRRAPTPGPPPKQSMDVFIYSPLHGWMSPSNWVSMAEAAEGGQWRTIMFVNKPVTAKNYFEAGELSARSRVLSLIDRAFRTAFQ